MPNLLLPPLNIFPGGSDGKESTSNVGDLGSIPGLGRSPRGGNDNPLQCSCLENPHGLYSPWNSPGQNTGVGSLSLLQEIFPTHGLNPGLPHCWWILYQLSHKEWVAYPFSSRSSNPGIEPGSHELQVHLFPMKLWDRMP